MALFQQTVITKYIGTQDKTKLWEKWITYKRHFLNPAIQENIKKSKEEQYQGEFLIDLFVNILGYSKNPTPNFNLTTELKNVKDSKKADGAILLGERVIGIIELKGTNTTDLGKIEAQAFGYKNNQPDCIYVITSNYEKLRFYVDNAIEHIEFNLFSLTDKEFEVLYLCLAYENIKNGLPKKLKEESVSQEDAITKKLYKDYSQFKRELYQNMTALNPQYDALELFKKSQKLLDRFLFLFFAEDRLLLAPNSVRTILSQWTQLKEMDNYEPLYARFRKFFNYLNTGYQSRYLDVFPYNGGLFKPDEVLDAIQIEDALLYNHTLKLSEYDFASEVDVNILGHIFENSLNELDEIKAQLEGTAIDKTQTKRKKDGVFYTPKYITKYIVDNTVGKLCQEKKDELAISDEAATLPNLHTYRAWLLQLTICDPACGSGAFLNEALNFLINEHQYLNELEMKLLGNSEASESKENGKELFGAVAQTTVENSILENNLFGVDLNEESVEIARLSLWLRTAKPNRKLNDLSNNIKCGNSLIDDPNIAGAKAFDWQKEFPQVFDENSISTSQRSGNTGFDVVIGNPPYVRQELFKEYSEYFIENYESYSGKADLFIYFYEKSLDLIKQGGFVSFISSGKFLEANYGKPLISLIVTKARLIEIIDFKDLNIFDGVSAYPLILTYRKMDNKHYSFNYQDATKLKTVNLNEILQNIYFDNIQIEEFIRNDFKFLNDRISNIVNKVEKNSVTLENLNLLPLVGIKTGYNEGFLKSDTLYSKDYIFGRDIKKYSLNHSGSKIFFPYTFTNGKYELIEEQTADLSSLNPEKNHLEKRAIIKEGIVNGTKKWYEFQQINKKLNFENEYIIYPNVSLGNNFTLSKGIIIDMTGFIIPSNSKYLLCILNSKLMEFLMALYAISRRGGYLEYKIQYISKLPIKDITIPAQQPFIAKADLMLSLNKDLQTLSEKFQRNLQREFGLAGLPSKLADWYGLTYADFLKELEKQKVKITLSKKAEWEDYFGTESKKAQAIKLQINTTDREIDQMVYALYELTPEEIAIVENG